MIALEKSVFASGMFWCRCWCLLGADGHAPSPPQGFFLGTSPKTARIFHPSKGSPTQCFPYDDIWRGGGGTGELTRAHPRTQTADRLQQERACGVRVLARACVAVELTVTCSNHGVACLGSQCVCRVALIAEERKSMWSAVVAGVGGVE